ncbi:uncharacterized protein EDB91DRAFT_1050146 [Suillus paluster]|uniref:uncharacterized protein n=1 Tax=Suillus paluster TaxID=48578 RepID=UPI001B86693D|nr:uncharacterized protein EDB91DRAFT_1050146 [Suillus paluster]KAG1745067.1 hypothetical protein EDB91DRAFT_1050146 [Suillus paluster]
MNIILIEYKTERLMKDWNSPVYAFFDPTPQIIKINGRRAHDFKCQANRCKTKVRRYLDKGDARSTGNMRKHVRSCWGDEVLKAADQAKDANEVRQEIVGSFLQNGSITASFECKGKGKVTYSHRQHTRAETRAEIVRWVSESLRPFDIVKDRAFQSLMKTGRPEYYIPSPSTVSRDVRQVFVRTRQRVATMLQEYDGKINFTTDGWSSPNHRALVAFSAHFEHEGELLSIPLDVVEVTKVKTYLSSRCV